MGKATRKDFVKTMAAAGAALSMPAYVGGQKPHARVIGANVEQANALLRREYREPFVIRDEV